MEKKVFTFYSAIDIPESLMSYIHEDEKIQFAVKTFRDAAIITDKRILIADKQGITGKKIEYYSIPFKNIITYSIETAGAFDFDSEIKLVMSGGLEIELKFMKEKTLNDYLIKVYNIINNYVITRS